MMFNSFSDFLKCIQNNYLGIFKKIDSENNLSKLKEYKNFINNNEEINNTKYYKIYNILSRKIINLKKENSRKTNKVYYNNTSYYDNNKSNTYITGETMRFPHPVSFDEFND